MVDDPLVKFSEVQLIVRELCVRVLDRTHPGWSDVVGLPEEDGSAPPDTPYRRWLQGQPEEYQRKLNCAFDPIEIGYSIDLFRNQQLEIMELNEAFQR